jgi:hypothetical protein
MKNNATLIKAARLLDEEAEALKRSITIPGINPLAWIKATDAKLYREFTRTADRLRAITLEAKP